MMSRNTRIGLIHKGAKHLLGIATTTAPDDRSQYQEWLQQQTGSRSCTALDAAELSRLVDLLRAAGALDDPRTHGAQGADRPTARQRAKLAALARGRGWDQGLDDPRLQKWLYGTCEVSHTRFLTRRQCSNAIAGLERWEAQTAQQHGRAASHVG